MTEYVQPVNEPVVVNYEPVTPVTFEIGYAIVDGRAEAHPEGKVIEPPTFTRPRGRTRARSTTKASASEQPTE